MWAASSTDIDGNDGCSIHAVVVHVPCGAGGVSSRQTRTGVGMAYFAGAGAPTGTRS